MRKSFHKRILSLTVVFAITSSLLFSQFDDLDFIKAGEYDASRVAEAYFGPWANAFGAGLNGNWYNTAKPHKLGGFDITVGLSAGIVPSTDDTFDVSKIGLKTFAGTGMSPTISGPDITGQLLSSPPISGVAPVTFNLPKGTDWKYIPVPSLQAGIGLPLGSEFKVRYTPKISISDFDLSLWGVGLVHSVMQYIPGDKLLPFDVSLFGGYTKLTSNAPIGLEPGANQYYSSKYPSTAFDNQNFKLVSQAWNASLLASLNLPVITIYGGLGYTKTSTVINLTGNFPLPTYNPAINPTEYIYEDAGVLTDFDPIDIENFSGMRANIGFRLKFAVITIHADYTRAYYNVFSTGFGISFR